MYFFLIYSFCKVHKIFLESNTETSIASTVFSTFCSTEDVRTKSQLATKTTISQMKSNKQQFCIRPGLEPIDATTVNNE